MTKSREREATLKIIKNPYGMQTNTNSA